MTGQPHEHVARRPREQRGLRRRQGPARDRSRGCPSRSRASAAYTVISVDDHVVEPPDAFTGRFPKKFADEEPRVVATDDGGEAWIWQGQLLPNVGFNAVVGRPSTRVRLRADPLRRDAPRRLGRATRASPTWTSTACARRCASRRSCPASSASGSRCGPTPTSSRSPRCARTTTGTSRRGAARTRIASSRTRSRTCATRRSRRDEIRRNAARGFKAVTFSEAPDKLGLPTIHSGYWDPLFAACEETGPCCACTSARRERRPPRRPTRRPRSPRCCSARTACTARSTGCTRRCPVRFPDIKHLPVGRRHRLGRRASSTASTTATSTSSATCRRGATSSESPSEVLRRNFWFCALDDDAGMLVRAPHRRRAHPRGVRLPARRLVVARHAGDARAPAPRPGRPRRRRARASPGRTRRSCSGTRCPTALQR